MLPDMDVLAFRFHIAYTDTFGHRGASHSLAFAVVIGLLAMLLAKQLETSRIKAFLFVGLACASHGLLDAFTNGGEGVALWWPFFGTREFFTWRFIEVSPLSLQRVFSGRGWEVLQSEFVWVWLPAILFCGALLLFRCRYASPVEE
jgi:inner membrane protein